MTRINPLPDTAQPLTCIQCYDRLEPGALCIGEMEAAPSGFTICHLCCKEIYRAVMIHHLETTPPERTVGEMSGGGYPPPGGDRGAGCRAYREERQTAVCRSADCTRCYHIRRMAESARDVPPADRAAAIKQYGYDISPGAYLLDGPLPAQPEGTEK